jgi:hypothetical protein
MMFSSSIHSPANDNISFFMAESDKGLMTRLYRELKELNCQKVNDPMKK